MAENKTMSDDLLDGALPVVLFLPVAVGVTYGPVAWADWGGAQREDLVKLTERLNSLGDQSGRLNEVELRRAYGRIEVRWIYAYGRHANAFFLWVKVQAPAFSRPFLALGGLQCEVVISFNLDDAPALTLLNAVVASKSLLLHFDAVPEWVRQLPPLSSDLRRASDYGRRGLQLVRSSLPLGFRPDIIEKVGAQLGQWQARRQNP